MGSLRPKTEPVALAALKTIISNLDIQSDALLTGVTVDSNDVHAGDLFVALDGAQTHGATFAEQAINKGASAILTDIKGSELIEDSAAVPVIKLDQLRENLGKISSLIYQNPSEKLKIFGVTGTNGKTTTSWLLHQGLQAAGIKTGLLGTAGIKLGDIELTSERTTPEAPQLQAMLALAVEQNLSSVVMEISSHALSMFRADGIWFESVGFTNLSHDHLDFHGDMESYFQAKKRLFTKAFSNFAAISLADTWGQRLASECEIEKTTIGTKEYANWILHDVSPALGHVDFNVYTPLKNNLELKLEFAGAFNAFNATLSLAMTSKQNLDREAFIEGIRKAHIPGRMEPILVPGRALAVVDYAHTPDAISAVIETLRSQTNGRVLAVLGAGGNRDSQKRNLMGQAVSSADLVIVTDDNPRDEDPAEIRKALISGISDKSKVIEIADRKEAIFYAAANSNESDTIVVLGKGHEDYQEIQGTRKRFLDSEVAFQALTEVN